MQSIRWIAKMMIFDGTTTSVGGTNVLFRLLPVIYAQKVLCDSVWAQIFF